MITLQTGGESEMKDVLVSIVVPIYNQERYLHTSIPCLMEQSYKNIEIILVNDGSTDSSKKIIENYSKVDKRICCVDKKNGGLVDATIAGIQASRGRYIAFLDPDDRVGKDFISRFIDELDQDYDFLASGFYYDNCGSLNPYFISNTVVYEGNALRELRDTYLYSEKSGRVSQQVFFARWNKLYKAETVKTAIETFEQCKGITLGEDTIFTFLVLMQSKKGKSIQGVNSYYYNIGNQNSMMKSKDISGYLKKANKAYTTYAEILTDNGGKVNNALVLYFFLIESLYTGLNNNLDKFRELYRTLKNDDVYAAALKYIFHTTSSSRQKVSLAMRLYCPFSSIYLFAMNNCVTGLKNIRNYARESKTFIRDCNRVGLKKGIYLAKFRKQRRTAFTDINALMPEMDSRISSIISDLKLKPEQETVEKNIFVFWWDGFEKAPSVVKKCIKSVEDNYSGFNVIRISKDNYKNYTDIDPMVLEGFETGKISVQTFSDILRFNLLKNNGGMWIDATIFFVNNYDLIGRLGENQSFNTLEFASSREFLNYKGFACSWSGFFIASKKNGLFVRTMDAIFREYYKKYGTYTLYFFIDAAFMTCKINGVDDDVLMKSQKCDGDMFLLSRVGNYPYNEACMTEIGKLPQKLAWNIELSKNERTFYTVLLN